MLSGSIPPDKLTGGPAFNVYRNTDQTPVTASTWVKVQLNAKTFDTANVFDSNTNYRFLPNTAGYYQICANISCNSSGTVTAGGAQIYKNGVSVASAVAQSSGGALTVPVGTILHLNGVTDYVELFGYANGTGTLSFGQGASTTTMSGCLFRSA